MRQSLSFLLLLILQSLLLLTSCFPASLADEDELITDPEAAASVRILTRSAIGEELHYPLHAYAFATDGGQLLAHQQISSSSEGLSLTLPQQTEARIVILSADPEAYDIPTSPTLTSVITPRVPTTIEGVSTAIATLARDYSASPLQMGFIDVRPLSANTTVTIPLHYQVASLHVQLTHLPAQCISAYISVATPASGITLSGQPDGKGSTRIPLASTLSADGTSRILATPAPVYLLPTTGNTTFTIAYSDSEGEQYASATYLAPLNAGTPYQLQGTYADGSLSLTGTITPSEWSDPIALNFTFANGGNTTITPEGGTPSSGNDPTTGTTTGTTIPELLTTWNDHLVVGYLDSEGTLTQDPSSLTPNPSSLTPNPGSLILLSLIDYPDLTSALNESTPSSASDIAQNYTEYTLTTGWRIPTEAEARYLSALYRTDPDRFDQALALAQADPLVLTDSKGNNLRYLCSEAQKTYSYKTNTITNAGATIKTYHLRLVRTVMIGGE